MSSWIENKYPSINWSNYNSETKTIIEIAIHEKNCSALIQVNEEILLNLTLKTPDEEKKKALKLSQYINANMDQFCDDNNIDPNKME